MCGVNCKGIHNNKRPQNTVVTVRQGIKNVADLSEIEKMQI